MGGKEGTRLEEARDWKGVGGGGRRLKGGRGEARERKKEERV